MKFKKVVFLKFLNPINSFSLALLFLFPYFIFDKGHIPLWVWVIVGFGNVSHWIWMIYINHHYRCPNCKHPFGKDYKTQCSVCGYEPQPDDEV